MIKLFAPKTCAFDAEWVPCANTAKRLLDLPSDTDDKAAISAIWQHYATPEEPRPFLKLVLSKIVTIAAVFRQVRKDGSVSLQLYSHSSPPVAEGKMICDFLEKVAGGEFQLWGYNSNSADVPILKQRALALGVPCPLFSKRPNKPWEGADYHDRNSDWHIDILQAIGGFGRATPKLEELAVACGLPGKLGISGEQVADLYLSDNVSTVLEYNCTDAVTTHLLMLQIAHHCGHLSQERYEIELAAVRQLVLDQIALGSKQFQKFLAAWEQTHDVESKAESIVPQPKATSTVATDATPQQSPLNLDWAALMQIVKAKLGIRVYAAVNSAHQKSFAGSKIILFFAENEFAYKQVAEHRERIAELFATSLSHAGLELECRMGRR